MNTEYKVTRFLTCDKEVVLATDFDALTARCAELERGLTEQRSYSAELFEERNDARAKLQAAERDAARYRWLRDQAEDYDGHACFPEVQYPAPIPDTSPFNALDAAIDAALAQSAKL